MSDQFVLHSYRRCPFAMRTRIVLQLKKIPYRVVEERLGDWTDFLKENVPQPRVPILVHNGRIIRESNDINLYLERVVPEPTLLPAGEELLDEMRQWWQWCDGLFKPAVDQFKYTADEEFRTRGRVKILRLMGTLEDGLGCRPYLCGETLSLADIAVIPFVRQVMRVRADPVDFSDFPRISAWAAEVLDAPYFQERVMKKYPFAKPKRGARADAAGSG